MPFPASMLSLSPPASATIKSPAYFDSSNKRFFAFLFFALSPVIITAPLFSISGDISAFLYSLSIIFFTPFALIMPFVSSGVKYIFDIYNISFLSISTLGAQPKPSLTLIKSLLIIKCVVVVPMSIPVEYIISLIFLQNTLY